MKIEATLLGQDISRSGEEARRLEEAGVDAVYSFEGAPTQQEAIWFIEERLLEL